MTHHIIIAFTLLTVFSQNIFSQGITSLALPKGTLSENIFYAGKSGFWTYDKNDVVVIDQSGNERSRIPAASLIA